MRCKKQVCGSGFRRLGKLLPGNSFNSAAALLTTAALLFIPPVSDSSTRSGGLSDDPGIQATAGAYPVEKLRIIADPVEEVKAERLRKIAEFELERLSNELSLPPPPLITIDLARTERLFFRKTGGRAPHWGAGIAFPRHGYIVLNSEKIKNSGRDLPETVSHELTHVLLGWNTPDPPPPAWFNEGLAMFEAGQWHLEESFLVARAVIFDTVIPLYKLEKRLPANENMARLAYSESYTAVALIAENHTRDALREICGRLAAGETFESAFNSATGKTREEFEYIWIDYLHSRFRWMYLFTDTSLLWGFMTLLVMAGFVIRTLRRRRKLRIMEEEEEAMLYRKRRFNE